MAKKAKKAKQTKQRATYVQSEKTTMGYNQLNKNKTTVKCNVCGTEWQQSIQQVDYVEEHKWSVMGLKCPNKKCKKLYISYVTDNKLRDGMYKAQELLREYQYENKLKNNEYASMMECHGLVPSNITKRWRIKLNTIYDKYQAQVEWNKSYGKELRTKYMEYKHAMSE